MRFSQLHNLTQGSKHYTNKYRDRVFRDIENVIIHIFQKFCTYT